MPLDGSANPILPDGVPYDSTTPVYAYEASGGYVMEQGVPTIKLTPYETIRKYDVSQAFQVKYDVRAFNEKIGLYKDASNVGIIDSSYNYSTSSFPMDSVSLSASEFRLGVSESNILSLGYYHNLYRDFETLLNSYFGFPQGFNSLFSLQSQININGGIFDASAMINLINYRALNASGEYINTMTGNITVGHMNALLRYACIQNPFNNRTTQTPADGFIANDLIYVPTGTKITLVANFLNTDTSMNYIHILPGALTQIQAQSGDFTDGDYSQETTFNEASIVRVVKVPMLLKLLNLSTRELYEPTTQLYANLNMTIEGITSPLTDTFNHLYLSSLDLTILQQSIAIAIGVNPQYLTLTTHSVALTPSSRSFTSLTKTAKPPEFSHFRDLVLHNLRSATYTADIRFNLSATLLQINQSQTPTPQFYKTAGEYINNLTNTLTNPASQQSLRLAIITTSQINPYSSLAGITSLSGMMAEVETTRFP
jgi:hypothetical protein